MRLGELASRLGASLVGRGDIDISAVTQDSRLSKSGLMFAALPGARVNGLDFVDQVLKSGASALLLPKSAAGKTFPIPVLYSDDCRSSFGKAAALMCSNRPKNRVAITGTNGKTSVAHFARELLTLAGKPAASAGTLGLMPEGLVELPPLTTPDPVALFGAMETVACQGFDHFIMEASSHGLEQRRLDGFDPNIAVFTNFSRDHLDYHMGMTAYAEAKFRLFRSLLDKNGLIISNADDEFDSKLRCLPRNFISYGVKPSDLQIISIEPNELGQKLKLSLFGTYCEVQVALVGAYQAHNLMAALGVALGSNVEQSTALKLLEDLPGVPGRMEIAAHKDGKLVIVDYAHTPDALEVALKSARPHVENKLRVVFGAGGDRDSGKRPLMGSAATKFADVAYVTDDNPRSEDPTLIRSAVMTGGAGLIDAGDRRSAIARALEEAKQGDVIVIAGKGHETTQDIKGVKFEFDDRLVTAELAKDLW